MAAAAPAANSGVTQNLPAEGQNYNSASQGSTAAQNNFAAGVAKANPQNTPTTAAENATASPTVVTDANIRENTIPAVQSAAQAATTPAPNGPAALAANQGKNGQSPTQNGTPANQSNPEENAGTDYEAIYDKILGNENAKPTDQNTQAELGLINGAKSNVDQTYNAQIGSIQAQYNQQASMIAQSQQSTNAKENALFARGGFSSSTIAPLLSSVNRGFLQDMATLTDKENTAVASINTAISKNDYQSAQDQLAVLEKVQSDRSSLAQKVTDSLITQNQTSQKQIQQSETDNQIANVFSSGITDPNDILKQINSNGGNVTLAQINTALKTLSTNGDIAGLTGSVKNFYELKANGGLPSSISSLPADQQLKAFLDLDKTTAATKPLYTTTDGADITSNDISSGVQALEASIPSGSQYADPTVYEAMYDKWVNAGLDPQAFLKNYPPQYYIDPSDTSLPSYLQPKKSASAGVSNPFASSAASST